MTLSAPQPPLGAAVDAGTPLLADEVARWRHAAGALPYVEVVLHATDDGPAVTFRTGPARLPLERIADPDELDHIADLARAGAAWIRADR